MRTPHERGATNEIVTEAHGFVDVGVGRHCAVVAAVLHCQTDPGTAKAEKEAGEHAGECRIQGVRCCSVPKDSQRSPFTPRSVRTLRLLHVANGPLLYIITMHSSCAFSGMPPNYVASQDGLC